MADAQYPANFSEPDDTELDQPIENPSRWQRFKTWYGARKKWSIPLTGVILILVLVGIPWTRYQVAGLGLKKDFGLQVLDSETHTPVSGATVSVGSVSSQTDPNGRASLHLKVGHHLFTISKKYYSDQSLGAVVPIFGQKNKPQVSLVATGRQVKITVTNLISKQSLAGVLINAAGASATTDNSGTTIIVLPVGSSNQKATLKLNGFNDTNVDLKVSDNSVSENDLTMTPAGKVYFLSKLSGNIDVVKTDLDGKNRQTVLAGTGTEDNFGTILLASRDWKYLALLSARTADKPRLYLIDTSTDQMSTIDSSDGTFTPVGWSDDYFIYTIDRNGLKNGLSKRHVLKSYNAQSKQLLILDQSLAATKDNSSIGPLAPSDWAEQNFTGVFADGSTIVYAKYWNPGSGNPNLLIGRTTGIYSIRNDGKYFATLQTTPSRYVYYVNAQLYKPSDIYYTIFRTGLRSLYYEYLNGGVKTANRADVQKNSLNQNATYLVSPSGDKTFWSQDLDGKNRFSIGDASGNNAKSIASLDDSYLPYGWFSDDYLLLSKKGSELYIMPVAGVQSENDLIKISDYHKPTASFYGYGGI